MSLTVTSELMEPFRQVVALQRNPCLEWRREGMYDRDTVPADASVALEDYVAAFVDCKAVVLVVDRAIQKTRYQYQYQDLGHALGQGREPTCPQW